MSVDLPLKLSPSDRRREQFALNVALHGMSAAEAYRNVYTKAKPQTAECEGPKMAKIPRVSHRIEELLRQVEEKTKEAASKLVDGTVLSSLKKRQILFQIATMDYADIPVVDGKPDISKYGHLIKGMRQTKFGPEVLLHDRLAAVKIDNEMTGETGGSQYEEIAIIMRRMIQPGAPADRLKGKSVVLEADTW